MVFGEDLEQVAVTPRQTLLEVRWKGLRVRVQALLFGRGDVGSAAALAARERIDVQFRDVHFHPFGGESLDAVLDLAQRRVDQPVSLNADGVDAHAGGLELADQSK